jgi:hypothetical protein
MRLATTQQFIRQITRSHTTVVIAVCLLLSTSLSAQDVEQVIKAKPVTISGGVTANTTFYNAQGIANRRDPFYWLFNANLNLNLFGIIQAPFALTLTQQDKRFSQPQPFNRFGISPRYKAITTHFGYRAMNFSEYTLAGVMFLGAGVEVNPSNSFIRVSAMYGRLTKAVERSAQEGLVFAKPTFRRMGYGLKVGLGRKKHTVDLIFFKAKDDINSIDLTPEVDVTPEENLVGAIHTRHQFGERINAEFEYAYSLYTRDTRAEKPVNDTYTAANNLFGLYNPNMSSEFNKAITAMVNYNGNGYQANLKVRQVDPGYRSLGAAFLNNGLKDITGGAAWSMFAQRLNISTNAGVQQTTNEEAVVRVIYAINVNYLASKKFTINSSYSNFSTTTRQTQIRADLRTDTLQYFQVTRSGNVSLNYRMGTEQNPNSLMLSANIQDATDSRNNSSTFYSFTFGDQIKVAQVWNVSVAASMNKNTSAQFNNVSAGPIFGINRSFLKNQLRSSASVTFLRSFQNATLLSNTANAMITNSIRLARKHSIALNCYYLKTAEYGERGRHFSEVRGMVNYGYTF